MEIVARYHDGLVADAATSSAASTGEAIHISELATTPRLDDWPAADRLPGPRRRDELRIGVTGKPYGARLVFSGKVDVQLARKVLPALAARHRRDSQRSSASSALPPPRSSR